MARCQGNDIWTIKVGCGMNGQAGLNISHWFVFSQAGLGCTDLEFVTGINAAMAAPYKAWLNANATYYGCLTQRQHPLPLTAPVTDLSLQGGGSGGATAMPANVSGVIKFTTTLAGRSHRGRIYIPFPSTAWENANGSMSAGGIAAANAIAAKYLFTVTYGVLPNTSTFLCVITNRTGTSGPDVVQTASCSQKWGSQRKRGDYGQKNVLPPF